MKEAGDFFGGLRKKKARLLHRGRAFVLVLTLQLLVFQKVFWIN
jgi:hypothetical protein